MWGSRRQRFTWFYPRGHTTYRGAQGGIEEALSPRWVQVPAAPLTAVRLWVLVLFDFYGFLFLCLEKLGLGQMHSMGPKGFKIIIYSVDAKKKLIQMRGFL